MLPGKLDVGTLEWLSKTLWTFYWLHGHFFLESWDLAFKDMDLIWRLCHGGLGVLGHGAVFLGQFSAGSEQFSLMPDLFCCHCYIAVR